MILFVLFFRQTVKSTVLLTSLPPWTTPALDKGSQRTDLTERVQGLSTKNTHCDLTLFIDFYLPFTTHNAHLDFNPVI